ncbi:MAG: hypothetical protein GWP42_03955, partial [Verrucomicrobiales bacterium]|nr:hypothetical protein [Verrucomicrobiales bacterium]
MSFFLYVRLSFVLFVFSSLVSSVMAETSFDFHEVRGREAKVSNLDLPQVVVKGSTIEHLSADYDGFYSITFDSVPGATGIELDWDNEGGYKHWTIREIEAYAKFGTKLDIVAGKVVPGPARTSDTAFANAFDGDVETFTYTTQSLTSVSPQRTLLELGPGSHAIDRIRINDVAGNGDNGRMQRIRVRITTDTDKDLAARKYFDTTNLSVQIFGEHLMEGELLSMKGRSRPQGMSGYGDQWSSDSHLLWDGLIG